MGSSQRKVIKPDGKRDGADSVVMAKEGVKFRLHRYICQEKG